MWNPEEEASALRTLGQAEPLLFGQIIIQHQFLADIDGSSSARVLDSFFWDSHKTYSLKVFGWNKNIWLVLKGVWLGLKLNKWTFREHNGYLPPDNVALY